MRDHPSHCPRLGGVCLQEAGRGVSACPWEMPSPKGCLFSSVLGWASFSREGGLGRLLALRHAQWPPCCGGGCAQGPGQVLPPSLGADNVQAWAPPRLQERAWSSLRMQFGSRMGTSRSGTCRLQRLKGTPAQAWLRWRTLHSGAKQNQQTTRKSALSHLDVYVCLLGARDVLLWFARCHRRQLGCRADGGAGPPSRTCLVCRQGAKFCKRMHGRFLRCLHFFFFLFPDR